MMMPRDDCVGAKLSGFVPREDGELSKEEQSGLLLVSGDPMGDADDDGGGGHELVRLNGQDVRDMDFVDILHACRDEVRRRPAREAAVSGGPRVESPRFERV